MEGAAPKGVRGRVFVPVVGRYFRKEAKETEKSAGRSPREGSMRKTKDPKKPEEAMEYSSVASKLMVEEERIGGEDTQENQNAERKKRPLRT